MLNPDNTYFFCDFETTGLEIIDLPIEVGMVVCNSHLDELETYQSYIRWSFMNGLRKWPPHEAKAFGIHGIPVDTVQRFGKTRYAVGDEINKMARRYDDKCILVSDNIHFEWRHMKKLLPGSTWPFHYCGWDTSLLLEMTGIGDPESVHRALPDVRLIVDAVRQARDRLRLLESYEKTHFARMGVQ